MLLAAGVTHILNVSNTPSVVVSSPNGFREVTWVPLDDGARWVPALVTYAIDTLHGMACAPDAHVYVHCIAGQYRAPTVLWLYLIALGIPPDAARAWIEHRSPVAAPGDHRMVDDRHVLLAQKHGLAHFFPHRRPEIVVPFEPTQERSA